MPTHVNKKSYNFDIVCMMLYMSVVSYEKYSLIKNKIDLQGGPENEATTLGHYV